MPRGLRRTCPEYDDGRLIYFYVITNVRSLTTIVSVALMLAVLALGAMVLYDLRSQSTEAIELSRADYPVSGIDLSAHNGEVDFDRLPGDSLDFIIFKATEGATFKDPRFEINYRGSRQAGIKAIGAYHFFRFETDGTMQAINMLHSLHGKTLELPLIIDIEEWTNPRHVPTDSVVGRLRNMLEYLEANGQTVMLYTNKDGYDRFVKQRFEHYPLWICSFTRPPLGEEQDSVWSLWQYSHQGWINSCKSPVDLNTFNGTREQWSRWLRSVTF